MYSQVFIIRPGHVIDNVSKVPIVHTYNREIWSIFQAVLTARLVGNLNFLYFFHIGNFENFKHYKHCLAPVIYLR